MASIEKVVQEIKELEDKRAKIGKELSKRKEKELDDDTVQEEFFFKDIELESLTDDKIGGVDGGFARKEMHGIEVVIARAVASVFEYMDGKLKGSDYIPSKKPQPEIIHIDSPLNRQEFRTSTSLIRLKKEIKTARKAVTGDLDLLLLDGSIVPQYTDRPSKNSPLRKRYDELVEEYKKLFEECLEKEILLAGVIEDSRGTTLSEILAKQDFVDSGAKNVLESTRDTNILDYVLEKGQRTAVTEYTREYENHPVLQDIGELGKKVYNFYLKTAKDDRPVRIDFLDSGGVKTTADRIASKILPLCSYSSTYGIPSVIVEADKCAKLDEDDIERFLSRLTSVVGPVSGTNDLRRDSRPF
ncbi:MAG: DNA double-strand break repair nuclease NurA [Candidatus Nanohaloarchaeota archaeon QJJ-9]|nr:DNA double-strand break repair nuclease NurA [Candidatus Nanohaloarchaeota archaeon QJJ-9]